MDDRPVGDGTTTLSDPPPRSLLSYGPLASRHSFGDIPMARRPATAPSSEASGAERLNRICIRKALILHVFSRALVFSVKLEGRCVFGARGGLSLTASS
jgi:hypothetical protein